MLKNLFHCDGNWCRTKFDVSLNLMHLIISEVLVPRKPFHHHLFKERLYLSYIFNDNQYYDLSYIFNIETISKISNSYKNNFLFYIISIFYILNIVLMICFF